MGFVVMAISLIVFVFILAATFVCWGRPKGSLASNSNHHNWGS